MDEQKVSELAQAMGVSVADLRGFLAALSIWMRKGYSLEESIQRHMSQMTRFVNRSADLARDADIRAAVANSVWDAHNPTGVAA